MSAVAINGDGSFVCFADKFGVVYAVGIEGFSRKQASTNKKGIPILSHYCSIITSLVCHISRNFFGCCFPEIFLIVAFILRGSISFIGSF